MYEAYDKWPDMAKNCYKNPLPKIDLKNINHMVFAGMGGSGAIQHRATGCRKCYAGGLGAAQGSAGEGRRAGERVPRYR